MSNFTKSFNFRNGVQVDDDNFVISPTGLVGIGTTQPKKSLDVFGDTRVSGMASLNNVDIVGILTVGNNITIDATTGIISATSFDGSVSGAGGIVAIATDGFIQNVGALTTDAKVGIKTDNPEFSLQVGSNPVSSIGVGITDGDIFVSGLTTTRNLFTSGISTFVGFTTQTSKLFLNDLIVAGISTFIKNIDLDDDLDVDGHTELDSLNVAGLSTFNENVEITKNLVVSTGTTISDGSINVTGIITANELDISGNIDIDGHTELDGLNVSGVSTFNQDVDILTGATIDNVQVGVTSQNYIDTKLGSGDLFLLASSGQVVIEANSQTTGLSTITKKLDAKSDVSIGGTVGFAKTVTFPDNQKIILGDGGDLKIYHGQSPNDPSSGDQHSYIQDSGTGDIVLLSNQVAIRNTSETEDMARFFSGEGVELYHANNKKFETVGLGASIYGQVNVAQLNGGTSGLSTYFGSLRYGSMGGYEYSTNRSLNLFNADSGNVNFYLDKNNSGSTVGDFNWLKGTSNPLLTLTNGGNLGIGETQPIHPLHVSGIATIGDDLFVSNNLTVGADATVVNNLSVLGDATFDVTGDITGDINSTGLSTITNLTGTAGTYTNFDAGQLTVNCNTETSHSLQINNLDQRIIFTTTGNIGVRTDDTQGLSLLVRGATVTNIVGIGTTQPKAAVDFSVAGKELTGSAFENKMFMLPPQLTNSERIGLSTDTGALIYNTSINKLQVYVGNNWETITSS